jgi:hypothetical protein
VAGGAALGENRLDQLIELRIGRRRRRQSKHTEREANGQSLAERHP